MFNYLLVINPTSSRRIVYIRDEVGTQLKFIFDAHSNLTNVPAEFKQELIDNYDYLIVRDMQVTDVGDLGTEPARCSQGTAGDFGYVGSTEYYCITDGEWLRNPPYPDSEDICPIDPRPDSGSTGPVSNPLSINVDVVEECDGSRKNFTTTAAYVSGSLVVYLNGLPYSEVNEQTDTTFILNSEDYAPDAMDVITVTYENK